MQFHKEILYQRKEKENMGFIFFHIQKRKNEIKPLGVLKDMIFDFSRD